MRRTKVTQIYKKTGNRGQSSSCWGTRRWTAPSDTSASSSKMPSLLQRPLKSNNLGRLQGRPTPAVHHRCLCCGAASADRPFAVVAKPRYGQTYAWSFWTFVDGVPKQTVAQGLVSEHRNSDLQPSPRCHRNRRQRGWPSAVVVRIRDLLQPGHRRTVDALLDGDM